jgi:hypothetical protein
LLSGRLEDATTNQQGGYTMENWETELLVLQAQIIARLSRDLAYAMENLNEKGARDILAKFRKVKALWND